MQTGERGMKKWAAFQSITDQFEGIRRILYDQKKIARPILDEDKIDEINRTLVEAYNKKLGVLVTYYNEGCLNKAEGHLENISTVYKCIEVINLSGHKKVIPYIDIVDVEIR